eukprot:Sdes_comp19200_c0_seq1m10055
MNKENFKAFLNQFRLENLKKDKYLLMLISVPLMFLANSIRVYQERCHEARNEKVAREFEESRLDAVTLSEEEYELVRHIRTTQLDRGFFFDKYSFSFAKQKLFYFLSKYEENVLKRSS